MRFLFLSAPWKFLNGIFIVFILFYLLQGLPTHALSHSRGPFILTVFYI